MNFCVGKDSYSSQAMTEGSESILLVATLRSPFVPQTKRCNQQKVEKCNRLSSGPYSRTIKSNHVRKCTRLSSNMHERLGTGLVVLGEPFFFSLYTYLIHASITYPEVPHCVERGRGRHPGCSARAGAQADGKRWKGRSSRLRLKSLEHRVLLAV